MYLDTILKIKKSPCFILQVPDGRKFRQCGLGAGTSVWNLSRMAAFFRCFSFSYFMADVIGRLWKQLLSELWKWKTMSKDDFRFHSTLSFITSRSNYILPFVNIFINKMGSFVYSIPGHSLFYSKKSYLDPAKRNKHLGYSLVSKSNPPDDPTTELPGIEPATGIWKMARKSPYSDEITVC